MILRNGFLIVLLGFYFTSWSQIQIVEETAINDYSGKIKVQAEGAIGPFRVEVFQLVNNLLSHSAIGVNGIVEFSPLFSSNTYKVVVTPERYSDCKKILYPVVRCGMSDDFQISTSPSTNCDGSITIDFGTEDLLYNVTLYDENDIFLESDYDRDYVIFEGLCDGRYTVRVNGVSDDTSCGLRHTVFVD